MKKNGFSLRFLQIFVLFVLSNSLFSQTTIVSHSPGRFEVDILPTGNITVTFSDNIDENSIDSTTFNVDGSVRGLYTGVYSGGGTTSIIFDPDSSYFPGEVISITLTTDIQSTGAVALENKYSWHFTVDSDPAIGVFLVDTVGISTDGAVSVFAADIDDDGDIDILSASGNDNKIAWYKNEGNGIFSSYTVSDTASQATSVRAADIDGDNDLDIVSSSYGNNTIAWYENDGNESFTGFKISTLANGPSQCYVSDVDGDGDMDVLSSSYLDNEVAWYENDGNENFTQHIISNSVTYASSVNAGDIDNDGDIDVISAAYIGGEISWFENNGSESFSSANSIYTSITQVIFVLLDDIDNDGDLDVVSSLYNEEEVVWFENDGSGNFSSKKVISDNASGAKSVHAADIDGDGDTDVLSASFNDDKIAWYENDGNEAFTIHDVSTVADGATGIYAADIDGDADLDIISALQNDDMITWYKNTSPPVFLTQPGSVNIMETDNTEFSVTTSSIEGPVSYQWQVDPGTGFEDITDDAIYNNSTTSALIINATTLDMDGNVYRCKAENNDSFSFSDNASLSVYSVSVDYLKNDNIVVYPNPVKDYLFIKSENLNHNYTVKLIDLYGKLLMSKNVSSSKETIDMTNLSPGVYNIIITAENNYILKKVIKQ